MTDHVAIAAEMNAMKLPGLRFDTVTRKVVGATFKFAGETIRMVRIQVTDRNAVKPVEMGIRLMRAIYARHPKEFTWRTPQIDRLGGTDQLRKAVEANAVDALIKQWDADAAKFAQQVKPYLIYK